MKTPSQILLVASALCATLAPVMAEEAKPADIVSNLEKLAKDANLDFGLTIEVSGSYSKQKDEKDTDINFDTFSLDFSGEPSDGISFSGSLLYEEGEDFCVDYAEFEFAVPHLEGLSLNAGLLYLPFGVFETGMISDPLTLELGEISDAAIGLKYAIGPVEASAYAFTGDIDEDPDSVKYAVALAYTSPEESFRLSAAILSDIGEAAFDDDANAALGRDPDEDDAPTVAYDSAVGVNLAACLRGERWFLAAEYLAAAEDMTIADEKTRPQTWSVDLGCDVSDTVSVALRYEGSKEFRPDEMPEKQFGGSLSYACDEYVTVSAEYLYGSFDDGQDLDDRHLATVQLAFEY